MLKIDSGSMLCPPFDSKARGIKTPISSPVKKRSKPVTEASKSKKA